MGSLEYFVDTHPDTITFADRLREGDRGIRLPRQIKHAMERQRKLSWDDAVDIEMSALKELRQSRERGTADLEALVAGSLKEMKMLFKQLTLIRNLEKKLERSYLFHYYRNDIGQRMLAKITKIKPGVSGRPTANNLKVIQDNINKLNPQEQEIMKKLLGTTD